MALIPGNKLGPYEIAARWARAGWAWLNRFCGYERGDMSVSACGFFSESNAHLPGKSASRQEIKH